MLNTISLEGRLVGDAETKILPDGAKVSNYTIAVERDYKKGDEKKSDFIQIVSWNLPDWIVNEKLLKGKAVIVSGRLQTRSYEKEDGQKSFFTEVYTESVYPIEIPKKSE